MGRGAWNVRQYRVPGVPLFNSKANGCGFGKHSCSFPWKRIKVATFVPEETPLAIFVFAHASKVGFAWKTVLISTDQAKLF